MFLLRISQAEYCIDCFFGPDIMVILQLPLMEFLELVLQKCYSPFGVATLLRHKLQNDYPLYDVSSVLCSTADLVAAFSSIILF